jgi:hypothetical protein
MPYAARVVAAVVGGVMFTVGVLSVVIDIARRDVYKGIGATAVATGVGLGLMVAAFVRRD